MEKDGKEDLIIIRIQNPEKKTGKGSAQKANFPN